MRLLTSALLRFIKFLTLLALNSNLLFFSICNHVYIQVIRNYSSANSLVVMKQACRRSSKDKFSEWKNFLETNRILFELEGDPIENPNFQTLCFTLWGKEGWNALKFQFLINIASRIFQESYLKLNDLTERTFFISRTRQNKCINLPTSKRE